MFGLGGGTGGLGAVWASVGLKTGPLASGVTKAQGMMKGLDASMTAAASRATFTANSVIAGFAKIGKITAIAGAAVGAVSLKMAADFDHVAREVNTLADLSEADFDRLKSSILDMSKDTEYAAKELMQGMYWVKSALPDASTAEGMEVLKVSSELATAGLADMADTADLVTTALNAWGLSVDESTRVADTLFEIVRRGKTTIPELTANFSKAATSAALMNVPIEDLGATIATLTRVGIPADRTLMALNRTLLGLNKPTKETTEWIHKLGFANAQAMMDSIGLQGVITELAHAYGGNAEAMAAMFPNIRELLALLPLTGMSFQEVVKDFEEFGDTTGNVNRAVEQMQKTLEYQFKEFKNKVGATLIEIGEKIMPVAISAVQKLGDIVEGKNEAFNTAGRFLKGAAKAAASFAEALVSVKPAIYGVVGALAALKLVGILSTGASSIAGGFTALHVAAANALPVLAATHPLITGLGVAGIAAAGGLAWLIIDMVSTERSAAKAARELTKYQKSQGELAAATVPLVTKLEAVRQKQEQAAEGSQEYINATKEVTDVQNQIAANFPSLISGWDSERNAILKNTDELKRQLGYRMGMAGIKPPTPGATPEYQNLETIFEQGEKAQANFEEMAGNVQSLVSELDKAGVETANLGYVSDAWYRSAEEGSKLTDYLLSQLKDSGELGAVELARIGTILDELNEESLLWGGTLSYLNDQIITCGPQWEAAVDGFLQKMKESGQAGREVPGELLKAFTSSIPEFQELGVQGISAWIQGASDISPDEAGRIAQQLFNTHTFESTGIAAVDAALAVIREQLKKADVAEAVQSAFGAVDLGDLFGDRPSEFMIEVKETGSDLVQKALYGVYETADKVDKSDPESKVTTPGANEAVRKLTQIWGIANNIPPEVRIKIIAESGTEHSPFTKRSPLEIGRWISSGIQEGYYASAGQLKAAVGFTGAGVGGTDLGPLTDEVDALNTAWAGLNQTALVGWSAAVDATEFGQVEQAIADLGKEMAGPQLTAWRNMRDAYDAAKAALKSYEEEIDTHQNSIGVLTHKQEKLNRAISEHQSRLSDLQRMKIAGEGKREDKSFKMQQDINKLQLGILKAQERGDFNEAARLARKKAELGKQKEIYDLETGVNYDAKKRALEKLLDPLGQQEMSYKKLRAEIKKEQVALGKKQIRLRKIEEQLVRERNKVWELKVEYDNAVKHVQSFETAINNMHSNFMSHYREMIAAQEELNRQMGAGAAGGGAFPSYQYGGPVMRTGMALVHKGEHVIPASNTSNRYDYHFDTLEVVLPNVRDYSDFAREMRGARLRMAVPQ